MGAARAPRAQPNPPLLSLEAGGAPNFAKLWKGKGGGEVESPAVGVEDEGFSNQSLPCTPSPPPPVAHTPSTRQCRRPSWCPGSSSRVYKALETPLPRMADPEH